MKDARRTAGGKRHRAKAVPASLEARVHQCYETLPPSERSVADLILNFPGRLATHSATELAAFAGASKAAVTRLIRRLGYATYAEARNQARVAQQWGSPIYLDRANGQVVESRSTLDAHVAADAAILHSTQRSLDALELDDAARALARARRVVVIGFRNSAPMAAYAQAQIGLVRGAVELAPMAGETLSERLVGLGQGDVLLAVGFRRRVPAFVTALRVAHEAGARVVLITDPDGAAALGSATWTLRCHCRGASMFDSYVAAISVLNYLATQVAHELGEPARKRLQEVEKLHGEFGDLA